MTAAIVEEARPNSVDSSKGWRYWKYYPSYVVCPVIWWTNEGKLKGFFRIPQVTHFVWYTSRDLKDLQIDKIPALLADRGELAELLQELLPRFKLMGEKLVAMQQAEQSRTEDKKYSHPSDHSHPKTISKHSLMRSLRVGLKRKDQSEHLSSAQKKIKRR